jgi:hypothetical protein
MTVIVVTGMGRERIAELIRKGAAGGDDVDVWIRTDLEAAVAVQSGEADFYIGACQSGAGGALGVATAILGPQRVTRLSGLGQAPPGEEVIQDALSRGVRAFGIAHTHVEAVVPLIVRSVMTWQERT